VFNTLLLITEEALKKKERELELERQGIQQQVAGSSLKTIMTNQFTEQVGLAQSDDKVHLKRMEAYIDEKMGVAVQNEKPQKVVTEEDKLFEIAQVARNPNVDEGSTGYVPNII
jgi:hypothetical protein